MHHTFISYKTGVRWVLVSVSLLLCILLSANIQAQGTTGYFTQAEKLFAQKQYYDAIQYYEKYLSTETGIASRSTPFAVKKKTPGKSNLNIHNEAVYHLAESYRNIKDFSKAEKLYKEATGFSTKAYPASKYWYGVTLRSNNKYSEALEAFTGFQEHYTQMDALLVGADKELANLRFILDQQQRLKDPFIVSKQTIGANGSAYAASPIGDTIYFTSIATTSAASGNNTINAALYKVASNGENFSATGEKVQIPDLKGSHAGLASFGKKGKKMFFTQWSTEKAEQVAAIYTSEKTDTGWSKPVKLREPVNMPGSSSTQPFVTSDGNYLLFTSNREGGVGKYDLWYAALDSNCNVLTVTNMGNIVNTPNDEFSPSYHTRSRQLLYSSNGLVGMGGFDIYYARGDFQLLGWEKPLNAGAPINSSKDDLYFISTDEDNVWNTGLLSSDRDTDCCLEVFTVKQDNAQFVSGAVIDCITQKPVAGVALTIKDTKRGKQLPAQETDAEGNYRFNLTNTSRFEITANKKGYESAVENYSIYFATGKDSVQNAAICLTLTPLSNSNPELDHALNDLTQASTLAKFTYNKSQLGDAYHTKLDSLASIMNRYPEIVIEIGGHTDTKGKEEYNLALAQKRVDACIQYLVKKGIAKERLVGKAYGECCPLEPDFIDGKDNPAARERNRRVEYKLLQGDIKE